MEFSFEYLMVREFFGESKEMHFMYRRLTEMLMDAFQGNLKDYKALHGDAVNHACERSRYAQGRYLCRGITRQESGLARWG